MIDLADLEWLVAGFKFKAKELEYQVLTYAVHVDAEADTAEIRLLVKEIEREPQDLSISIGDDFKVGDSLR